MSSRKRHAEGARNISDASSPFSIDAVGPSMSTTLQEELSCPICLQIMRDPYVTICGHNFCAICLKKSLADRRKCPSCNESLPSDKCIFVNFSLASIVDKFRISCEYTKKLHQMLPTFDGSDRNKIARLLASTPLDRRFLDDLLQILSNKQKMLAKVDEHESSILFKEFMNDMIAKRAQKISELNAELHYLQKDVHLIETKEAQLESVEHGVVPSTSVLCEFEQMYVDCATTLSDTEKTPKIRSPEKNDTKINVKLNMMKKRKIIESHFDDLEQYYLELRNKNPNDEEMESSRIQFRHGIEKITRYSGLRHVSTFSYGSESQSGLNIVSSIEFNRNTELFTIAGVKKKIQMYDYQIMIDDPTGLHFPMIEMQCNAKISAVHWNTYRTHLLASCDYEGVVQLWDACIGTSNKKFEEHEKRCWSVCFNYMDPNVLASGSDDAKVKLWSINAKDSVATLSSKVNVCSVHFNPESRFHLALGSADHCVHYYDLRNHSKPLMVFQGHKKAVSYVKYISGSELVSASTDSTLRLWNLIDGTCTRKFTGHQNEKNFVGLDVKDDFITCGSENGGIYIYYKLLSKPLIIHQFDKDASNAGEVDGNDFISSICWKKKSNVLLVANSQGTVKVLELV